MAKAKPWLTNLVIGVSTLVLALWYLASRDASEPPAPALPQPVMQPAQTPPSLKATEQPLASRSLSGTANAADPSDNPGSELPTDPADDTDDAITRDEAVAFAQATRALASIHQGDPLRATDIVEQMLNADRQQAERLTARLVDVSARYERDAELIARELLCADGVPRVYGDDVLNTLELVDVARAQAADYYYRDLAAELTDEQHTRLRDWIDETTTVAPQSGYRSFYADGVENADADAARFCMRFIPAQ